MRQGWGLLLFAVLAAAPVSAATVQLGTPVAAGTAWRVPVWLDGFTGPNVAGVSLFVSSPGLVVRGATAGAYWAGAAAVVLTYAAGGDTTGVSGVVSDGGAAGACAYRGPRGVLAWITVEGHGEITLVPCPIGAACTSPAPALRDCANTAQPGSYLVQRVLVPPEGPIAARRATWGAVKSAYH